MEQARTNPPVIVKRFDAQAYVIPRDVAAAVRPPYLRLRDLVVVEHEMAHLIDNVLIDLVSQGCLCRLGAWCAAARGGWQRPAGSARAWARTRLPS